MLTPTAQPCSRKTSIFVAERDIYDYSAGEAPAHLKTVLRVLDVGVLYTFQSRYPTLCTSIDFG